MRSSAWRSDVCSSDLKVLTECRLHAGANRPGEGFAAALHSADAGLGVGGNLHAGLPVCSLATDRAGQSGWCAGATLPPLAPDDTVGRGVGGTPDRVVRCPESELRADPGKIGRAPRKEREWQDV